uniref:hypothetical protein n=1 Tax=Acinetobacter venetianus TaxID=52133 RepID=UPI003A90FA93
STWDARASFSILPGSTLFEWYKPKLKSFSIVKELSKLALLVGVLVGSFVWFFSEPSTANSEVVKTEVVTTESTPVVHNNFPLDLSQVYISGSLGWRSSPSANFEYQYVLESPEGVFHPDDVGLSVVSVSRCLARVIDSISGSSAVVRCKAFQLSKPVLETEPDSSTGQVSQVSKFLQL